MEPHDMHVMFKILCKIISINKISRSHTRHFHFYDRKKKFKYATIGIKFLFHCTTLKPAFSISLWDTILYL